MLQWIMSIVHEEPATDYDRFIQDGSILSKVMTSIVFNSVALDQIDDNWGVVSFGTGHPPSEYHLYLFLEPRSGQSQSCHPRDPPLRSRGRL